jgi:hypothetical protein
MTSALMDSPGDISARYESQETRLLIWVTTIQRITKMSDDWRRTGMGHLNILNNSRHGKPLHSEGYSEWFTERILNSSKKTIQLIIHHFMTWGRWFIIIFSIKILENQYLYPCSVCLLFDIMEIHQDLP